MISLYGKTKFLKMFSTGDKIDISFPFFPKCPECRDDGIIDGYYTRGSNTGECQAIESVDDFYCVCHRCQMVHEFFYIGEHKDTNNKMKTDNWELNSYEV